MKRFLWIGCLSYLLNGMAHVVMGSALEVLLLHYGKSYTAGGQLIALQFAGFLAGVLFSPWLTVRLGWRKTLLFCLACLAVSEAIYALLPAWGVLNAAALFAGIGFGSIESVIGATALKYVLSERTKVMSRLEASFGVGALVMPLVAGMLIGLGQWRLGFLLVSLLALIALGGWLAYSPDVLARGGEEAAARSPETAIPKRLQGSRYALLAVFLCLFALYVGMEMSLASFLPAILAKKLGLAPSLGSLSVTVFWLTMSAGRLWVTPQADRIGHFRYLFLSLAGAAAVLSAMPLAASAAAGFAAVGLLGFLLSGVFAVSLILANSFFPGREERTTSLLIASGGLGGIIIPLLSGWMLDDRGTSVLMLTLAAFVLAMSGLVWLASRLRKERPQARETAAVKL